MAGHRDFELVGVADTEAERCREAEDTYGCAAFTDYVDLLAMPGLEAVMAVSWTMTVSLPSTMR